MQLISDEDVKIAKATLNEFKIKGEQCDNRDFILSRVRQNGYALRSAKDIFKNDAEIALAAIEEEPNALKYIGAQLRGNEQFILKLLAQSLEHGDVHSTNKKGTRVRAILDEASPSLKSQRSILLAAILRDRDAWYSLSTRSPLRDDEAFILTTIAQATDADSVAAALNQASPRLQDHETVVLAAVRKSGKALQWASERLQNSFQIVLEAIMNDPSAIRYASAIVQGDQRIQQTRELMSNELAIT
jgi:hypothetical protein